MVTEREKQLLDYMYGLAADLKKFIKINGYDKEAFEKCSLTLFIKNGEYVDVSLGEYYPSGSPARNVAKVRTQKSTAKYKECKWEEKA